MNTNDPDGLIKRIPEPELMDEPEQADAYARADFTQANALFVETFCARFPGFSARRMLDLGCGPGDIMLRLAHRFPSVNILGVDGASAMLDWARKNIVSAGLENRVEVKQWRLGDPGSELAAIAPPFDAILSNSLLHHLHEPLQLWHTIKACARPGTAVLVMDLARPATRVDAQAIVDDYSGDEPEILRRDFFNSLLAAFRVNEVKQQLKNSGLHGLKVERISDRHLAVSGLLRTP
jgi:cyclopropane fatty-acyl-phospholipid synthase-like methyltransferase